MDPVTAQMDDMMGISRGINAFLKSYLESDPPPNLYLAVFKNGDFPEIKNGRQGTFEIIRSSNIQKALAAVKERYGNKFPSTIVLTLHGVRVFKGGVDTGKRKMLTSPDNSDGFIDPAQIMAYLNNPSKNSTDKNNDITALFDLMVGTGDNGTFVFNACNLADDQNMVSAIQSLSMVSFTNQTIYLNGDYGPGVMREGQPLDIWTGETPLSVKNDGNSIGIEEGWTRINAAGPTQLKSVQGLNGSIYLDPQPGKKAINEM
ncbi:MAG: hypothetical protein U0W24_07920 [Bacteroidales bacterium]